MDNRWYLEVNRFARRTPWAHGFMASYYQRVLSPVGAGLVVLAVLALAGWWSCRRRPDRMAAMVWAGLAAMLSFGLSQIVLRAAARPRPYLALRHVEVLVPKAAAGAYAFPDSHAAIAAALVCGLFLASRWWVATVALLATLLLLFSGVYVGAELPSGVAAGAGLGAVVAVVLWPLGSWLAGPIVSSVAEGRLGWLFVGRGSGPKLGRRSLVPAAATRAPTAKAMDALRVASEAARNVPATEAPVRSPNEVSAKVSALRAIGSGTDEAP